MIIVRIVIRRTGLLVSMAKPFLLYSQRQFTSSPFVCIMHRYACICTVTYLTSA